MQKLYGATGGALGGMSGAGGFAGGAAPRGFPGASDDGPTTAQASRRSTKLGHGLLLPLQPVEQFPAAAGTAAGGKGFVHWMESDVFADLRKNNLYYPFSGKQEWEFARFLALSSLTMKEINEFLQLELVQQHLASLLSFKTAKELRQRIELLPTGPEWKSRTIVIPGFPTKKPIVLFYRNSLECIQLLLRNPLFANHLDLVPTKLYENGQRIHKEWINSDGAWAMQHAIPRGRTVLGVVASSDKTNISVMNGDRVAHPFLLSLANIQMDVATKASNNAFLMAALLPVPRFLCDKKLRSVMEARLFIIASTLSAHR
ncbi:RPN1-RPN2-N domain-containing protein [Mycena chlorophos]|uniref:RPN1-RPN2-N domain-containing protein n=1 Tax=Mycena chlorophos TaxID=658473 RepID=A0A8H6WIY6_MYCCL|nr:RPN1-RPN2-N domain-containing protein [Mycena chlorophos]